MSQSAWSRPGRSRVWSPLGILELLPLPFQLLQPLGTKDQELQLPGGARAVLNSEYSGTIARSAGNCSP
ncbi:hypothetical protein I79_020933 [Cricetulus griseus]|uniref:Uncharacterized protein n=1 Tax=Cricetulus griseus TaxID=10029 RepID=G3IBB3_CRIGR|nr:hypothetical protein I79_020933 [Cricetulus griseus]